MKRVNGVLYTCYASKLRHHQCSRFSPTNTPWVVLLMITRKLFDRTFLLWSPQLTLLDGFSLLNQENIKNCWGQTQTHIISSFSKWRSIHEAPFLDSYTFALSVHTSYLSPDSCWPEIWYTSPPWFCCRVSTFPKTQLEFCKPSLHLLGWCYL